MHRFHIRIVFICVLLFICNTSAQELTDSLQVESVDSIALHADSTYASTEYNFFSDSFRIVYSIVIFIVAFILSIYLRQPLQRLSERRSRYSHILKQIVPLLLIISWFLVIYFIVTQILDLSFISIVILFSVIGLALALAFQDILKDIIAGLIVPFEGHIERGNKIQIGDIYGEIFKTGFRETLIKKPDGNIVVIPNSQILKETVINVSAEQESCPVIVEFFLPFSCDLDKSRDIAHKSAIVSPYLFLDKPVTVHFNNELSNGQPFIKMQVQAFLRKIDFQNLFISELTETVLKEIGHATKMPRTG
jgi:small-conductance mechanosensitive channel